MWAVSPPALTAAETATACASGLRDESLRQRVLGARDRLTLNSATLQTAIANDRLHELSESDCQVPGISDAEMNWLYDQRFARLKRPGRVLYERLMTAAPYGLCCYCQYGQAKSLDHFVPRDHMASLAVDPWNLVPACEQCNHQLRARWSAQRSEQLLHPYRMPPLGKWLRGTVVDCRPVSIKFDVAPLAHHAPELQERMRNEFDTLGLAQLYSVVAAPDIAVATKTLQRNFAPDENGLLPPGNDEDVRGYLEETAGDAFRVDENSLRGAVLEALASDAWFCDGGYLLS